MKHVLIGWELGAGRGHIERVMRLADDLHALGCRVTLALQRTDLLPAERRLGVAVWQAPIWPHLLVSYPGRQTGTATMGDILAQIGLTQPGAFAALLGGWDAIIAATDPDLVISDYAPALLCATRGRIPRIAVGTGFERVPGKLAQFPILVGEKPQYHEHLILEHVNAQLIVMDRAPLASLPGLFDADYPFVSTFPQIDPYARVRQERYIPPSTKHRGAWPEARGEGIFVYGNETTLANASFWNGLAATGLPIRVYQPGIDHQQAARLREMKMIVEPAPLGLDAIAARSRLAVSHGGHGFLCSAMLMGLPHVALWSNLETRLHGLAHQASGLGRAARLADMTDADVSTVVTQAYDDKAMRERGKAARPALIAQMEIDQREILATILDA